MFVRGRLLSLCACKRKTIEFVCLKEDENVVIIVE